MLVDTAIPYGNAADVHVEKASPVSTVEFMPSPGGGRETMWFCFRLKNTDADCRQVRLVIKNFQSLLGGGAAENCRIVVRYEGGDWQRTEAGVTETQPDGRYDAVWHIDAPQTYADVAWCYPYGVPELDELVSDTGGYWKRDTIGLSQGSRPLYRICNSYGEENSNRPGLYLISRQHASETSGGWMLDGFLRHIASAGDAAPLVWAILLANIDDLEEGHYGKDPHPIDLNRSWGNPPMRHENLVFQRDMQRWSRRCKPFLTIDSHSPSACENSGIYVPSPAAELSPEHHTAVAEWAEPLERHLGEYALPGVLNFARYGFRQTASVTFSRYAWAKFNICGITFETPYSTVNDIVLTRESYRNAGSRIAAAVLERLQLSHR